MRRQLAQLALSSTLIFALSLAEILPRRAHRTLKAINLLIAGMLICVVSVLNFSLGVLLAVLLTIPLLIASPSSLLLRMLKLSFILSTTPLGLYALFPEHQVWRTIWSDFETLDVKVGLFLLLGVMPLQIQAAIVSCL